MFRSLMTIIRGGLSVPIYWDKTHEFHFVVDIYKMLLVYEPL